MISTVMFAGISSIIISIFFRLWNVSRETFCKNKILFLLIERTIVSRETIIIVNQNGLLS